ncbi:MAG: DUF1444 family protein [Chloroflexota bacterium]
MSSILNPEAFMQHVAKATEEAGFTVESIHETHLHITLNDQTNRLNLQTVYDAYCNAPDRLDDIITAHLSVLQKMPELQSTELEPDESQVLLPVLQRKSWLTEIQKQTLAQPIHRPFLTGLIVAYVIDTPHYRSYLNQSMIDEMSSNGAATPEDIHEHALHNLREHVKTMGIDTYGSFHETLITCETREGYASSCILLPDLMNEWDQKIPGDMLIGIPNRDFIIAFSRKHPSGIEGIEQQTQQDAQTRDRPLSGRLFKWKDDQVREFRPLN